MGDHGRGFRGHPGQDMVCPDKRPLFMGSAPPPSAIWGVSAVRSTPILRCGGQCGLWAGLPGPPFPLLRTRKTVFAVSTAATEGLASQGHEGPGGLGAPCGHGLVPPRHTLAFRRTHRKVSRPPAASGRLFVFSPGHIQLLPGALGLSVCGAGWGPDAHPTIPGAFLEQVVTCSQPKCPQGA